MSDRRVLFLNKPIEVFAGEVLFGAKKYLENQVPLRRAPQTRLLDMLKKDLFFLLEFFFFLRHTVRSQFYHPDFSFAIEITSRRACSSTGLPPFAAASPIDRSPSSR